MFTIEKTREALIKKFEESKWEEITLTIKATGDKVRITPCGYVSEIHSLKEVEYFLMDCATVNLCGSPSIDKIAKTLNEFAKLKEESESDSMRLEKFFKENIKGHTEEEYKIGSKIYDMVHEEHVSFQTPYEEIAERFHKRLGITKEKAMACFKLVEDCGFYSDWHKDVWGHRPRYSLG